MIDYIVCPKTVFLPLPSAQWSSGSQGSGSHEAVLDFILSTLITPRTVSAIIHAAKKLVCSNVMAMGPSGGTPTASGSSTLPPDIEVQHGIALLTTALRAIDTCLQVWTEMLKRGTKEACPKVDPKS